MAGRYTRLTDAEASPVPPRAATAAPPGARAQAAAAAASSELVPLASSSAQASEAARATAAAAAAAAAAASTAPGGSPVSIAVLGANGRREEVALPLAGPGAGGAQGQMVSVQTLRDAVGAAFGLRPEECRLIVKGQMIKGGEAEMVSVDMLRGTVVHLFPKPKQAVDAAAAAAAAVAPMATATQVKHGGGRTAAVAMVASNAVTPAGAGVGAAATASLPTATAAHQREEQGPQGGALQATVIPVRDPVRPGGAGMLHQPELPPEVLQMYAEPEIVRSAREVKMWCYVLLGVSAIRVMSIVSLCFSEKSVGSTPLEVAVTLSELVVRAVGLYVATIGLRSTRTLGIRILTRYCLLLMALAVAAAISRICWVVLIILEARNIDLHQGNADDRDDDNVDDPLSQDDGNPNTPELTHKDLMVYEGIQAGIIAMVSVYIWFTCVARAVRLRTAVAVYSALGLGATNP